MGEPFVTGGDLTARARIRNAALDLYAASGEDKVSMRAVAAEAGVAVGLVQHHFKTKEGLRQAVDQLIVDYHALAIADAAPDGGSAAQVAAARDLAVSRMLQSHPSVVNYMRRVLLDPSAPPDGLLARLTDLSRQQVIALRDAGVASTGQPVAEQTVKLMVRQLGRIFLQPMVDAMWTQLADAEHLSADQPALTVEAAVHLGS
ncbi:MULTISPECIES: TetR/AcrR family transcriptional regulator [Mycobacteriales]|jgi:AcrR family transcriptional regulator|uniref:TetR family transcriptional regulator n=4 Tax=Mycobacteriales TaxID=85007 RepID=A0A846WUR8_9ACTN|nr:MULTISPECIES: TetR family transcriptional regulator [Mycobacteriales]NKY05302.1 TetR family transcriptional regulator [Gordonia polyisoprenivorans]NKY20838.1 TetR family transcriptional regulator [Tsukamurella spumae]NMD58435.1 TetR family transcriptional regulator [Tsukamurella columbiensis]QUD82686.1 TetR family transcriptional regulator [Gordonia polyisoprenivorans]TWS24623.1 TetR family transcriptional regulator [Tsukamurella conjunctivitidis]